MHTHNKTYKGTIGCTFKMTIHCVGSTRASAQIHCFYNITSLSILSPAYPLLTMSAGKLISNDGISLQDMVGPFITHTTQCHNNIGLSHTQSTVCVDRCACIGINFAIARTNYSNAPHSYYTLMHMLHVQLTLIRSLRYTL